MTMHDTDYPFHPLSEIFPLVEGDEFQSLVDDITANGLRVPIVKTTDGQIVDGRNRYRACREAGVSPKFHTVIEEGDDLLKLVMGFNLHRRHLTPSQRAMVAARAREIYDRQAKDRQKASGGNHKKAVVVTLPQPPDAGMKSRDLAGKAASVSGTYVDRATKVIDNAVPEVIKAVDEGRMSVTTAAVLSSEPPEIQRKEADNPKRNRTYNSVSAPTNNTEEESEPDESPQVRGVGIVHANEAINCLTRIPKNDALRKRGFQLVTDWIRTNSK